jgi:A/G-specific adenine glycosylase
VRGDAALRLLDWFRAVRRDLPWRGPFPRDPYAVLVSEVMLQQTQVDRVIAGYAAFMRRFPTLAALAAACEDEVVEAFSGMGYYGRARRLSRAARALVERGGWPRSAVELAALPGLGIYTSRAVAAFAFAGSDPPVDGNLARIAARVRALPLPLGSAALASSAEALADELYGQAAEPDVFEALMELGATVCTPRAPSCASCPLHLSCDGVNTPERYPLPRRQRQPEGETWVALWLVSPSGSVLLRRIEDGSLLGGLWLPPLAVIAAGDDPGAAATALARSLGHRDSVEAAAPVRHSITHRRIVVWPFAGSWRPRRVAENAVELRLFDPESPGAPTSSLLGKLRRACTGPRQKRLDEWSGGLRGE